MNKEEIKVSKIQAVIKELKNLEEWNRIRAAELRNKEKTDTSVYCNYCFYMGRSIAFASALGQLEMALQENENE